MEKFLRSIILTLLFIITEMTVQSQLLYRNNVIGSRTVNPGLGTGNTPDILFDDINFPSAVVGMADSVVINQIKFAIGRAPGAPAVIVKVYATSADPAFALLNSLPVVPPKLVGTINLPAAGPSNIFTVGDGITPLFIFKEDTGRVFAGYQTLFVGLSFSDSTKDNGWYFGNGPDFNYDLIFKYDETNVAMPRISFNYTGSFNLPATFYTEVYGTVKFASPLPVTLNDFNVIKQGGKNVLAWQTETENNSSYFIVERSQDGNNFHEIGKVTAAGESDATLHYLFYDNAPGAGTNYYRIRTLNKDNTGAYSTVKIIRDPGGMILSIYPNPIINFINIAIDGDNNDEGFISITDFSGKQVYTRSVAVHSGKNTFNVGMGNLAKGVYVIRVQLSTGSFGKKVLL